MKIIAMSKRILKQLLRDTRTLLLIFIAPLIVLTLLKYVFTANTDITAKVATVGVEQKITNRLKKIDNIDVIRYSSLQNAQKALDTQKVDTLINYQNNGYDVTYANNNVEKTNLSKQAFRTVIEGQEVQTLKDNFEKMVNLNKVMDTEFQNYAKRNPQFEAKLPKLSKKINIKPINKVKIKNHYVYGNGNTTFFDTLTPALMSIFVFLFVFMISGVALLNERVSGTLERLLATPIRRGEIVASYFISYGIIAVLQTIFIVAFLIKILKFQILGNIGTVMLINILVAFVALTLGLLMSTLAKSQFQMMQFIPIVVVPQVFFTGIVPINTMPRWIQVISNLIPIKYSGDALTQVMINGAKIYQILPDLIALVIFIVVLVILNVIGLKKYRKV